MLSLPRFGSTSLVLALVLLAPAASGAADDVDFNRDIRPILSNHCFQCHGPDEETREADLRLDVRTAAIKEQDGVAAIVPGKPAESLLVKRISAKDVDDRMPPAEFGKPLSAKQIETLEKWIQSGADYAAHWSFQPIERPRPPAVAGVSHPIDAFVRHRLAEKGIEPSPSADRYTLIRRVHLDVLGLPPSIAEVDAFVNDERPDAYERMVDRALASPHFGERWGRHWLDQARYADSHGYTNDNGRSMWPYRDWVIAAFNRDLPFDEFTIEQLAGDLLEQPTLDQRVATGFHRNTLINSEGGTKADQFRDEQVKDRVDTTGLVWMALTVGCAKCHTHKFDPISQREYYELYSFFDSTADANSVQPVLKVPSALDTERIAELEGRIADLQKRIDGDDGSQERQRAWENDLLAKAAAATDRKGDPDAGWTVLPLSGKSLHGSKLVSLDDNSLLVSGPGGKVDEYHTIAANPPKVVRSVRLQVLTHESLPKNGPGRAGNGNFVLSEFWFRTGDGQELRFNVAGAEHSQPKYEVAKAIDGKDDTGWAINGAPEGSLNRNRTAWFVLPKPLEVADGDSLTFKLQFHQEDYGIGRFRISVSDREWQDAPDVSALAVLAKLPESDRSAEQKQKLRTAFMQQDDVLGPLQSSLVRSRKELDTIRREIATTMVMQELDKPRQTHVQIRGEFLRRADPVDPGVPAVLPPLSTDDRADRLELAQWLTSPEHPLTARVRVNRIWMRLFGKGLVETENDFGTQGSLPTHPELFDWLAAEFQRLDWSQKRMIRRIVTSDTYRQRSVERPDLATVDPRNLLLARQNRVRVEAEIVRDIALEVSGRRSTKIGGPSVHPPQEDGVYAFTQRKKSWKTSTGDDRYRRGMYTFFYRSAPYPMLETFDVPKFNTVCTRRDRSNTPIQSLTMSNAKAMFELAQHFGERIVASADGDDARIEVAFRTCFARSPQQGERTILANYLKSSRDRFGDEAKAWTAVARLLMNVDEFLVRE